MLHFDTIAAPATPSGTGGIGIIRLSGPRAEAVLQGLFRPSRPPERLRSHQLYHGRIVDGQGLVIDEVLAVVMRAPHSYTREDVVEIHCHGGNVILRRILDELLEAGVRLANPGEFTQRAFLNGRLDLSEAEAVIDLIQSRSEGSRRVALEQLQGRLSRAIHGFQHQLADLLALVETYVDFPEEDIPLPQIASLGAQSAQVRQQMALLLQDFENGRILREGLSVLILGCPNVGKSSLLNALLGEARAIVTPLPGTTRDTIEEPLSLGGIPLRLVDTAGVRETSDLIEAEGVRRAREKIAGADLILFVIDGSRGLTADDRFALELCAGQRLLVTVNKCDLGAQVLDPALSAWSRVDISAHTGQGLETLRQAIIGFFRAEAGREGADTPLLSDRRHREALVLARQALERFEAAVTQGQSAEFLAFELREALQGLGQITGETTPDDILQRIFSRFCIGK
jgi:tRNA modification GTPase